MNRCTCLQSGTLAILLLIPALVRAEPVTCPDVFAPTAPSLLPEQQPYRHELCLSGAWQFQPIPVPSTYTRNTGTPPDLSAPSAGQWDAVSLKVPSPWNVNAWGNGRNVGAGTEHPYWPDSVFFPSYPRAWDSAEMGWVRRTFRVPSDWQVSGQRLMLHFDAIAGDCQVFIDGKPVGTHFDKYLPFDLDITDAVNRNADNEILLGIRAHKLFDQRSDRYSRMHAPYPCGSNTDNLVGPWQDIYLRAVPAVRITDAFVQPQVGKGELKLIVKLRNDTDAASTQAIGVEIRPWTNLATTPEPSSRLEAAVLTIPAAEVTIPAHGEAELTLTAPVGPGQLKLWTPASPNLYTAVLTAAGPGAKPADRYAARFGWRQFSIAGKDLLLNGEKIQLTGDLLHPFSPLISSRRYAWAWYRMIKDMGGNAVRLHAQPHPAHFLDLADEMGLVVLDETALFGSSIALNFEPDIAWKRFEEHYDALVLRDRNHPAVLGWSFGNELFAIFNLNNVSKDDADRWYKKLATLGQRARALDPSRDWISCDGDEDLRGTLPVYSKHFGAGLPEPSRLPNVNKPLMVGESGGTYYARPAQLTPFNGEEAYRSYASRNDALAIDVYDNIVHLARPRLAYFSASETAWFGIEHLPVGYHDTSRLPSLQDGVTFSRPFADHTPGMQIERIPPYTTTFNPGWDPAVPLYKPLAMFQAEKAALANPPEACRWDRPSTRPVAEAPPSAPPPAEVKSASILPATSPLARHLKEIGVPLSDSASPLTVIDLDSVSPEALRSALARGSNDKTLFALVSNPAAPALAALPEPLTVTDRTATALESSLPSLPLSAVYFAEDHDPLILRHGLAGPLVDHATSLLQASNTDWSQFLSAPERAKCAAVVLYEQLQKPPGTALIEYKLPAGGTLYVTTLYTANRSRQATNLWRALFARLHLQLGPPGAASTPAIENTTVASALIRAGADWKLTHTQDRFVFPGARSASVSYWINSSRATDDLLSAGPDAPKFDTLCYASQAATLRVNDVEIKPARTEAADYRTLYHFTGIPLKKGWNHFVFEITSAGPSDAGQPPTAAIRIGSNNAGFLRSLDSAVEKPEP